MGKDRSPEKGQLSGPPGDGRAVLDLSGPAFFLSWTGVSGLNVTHRVSSLSSSSGLSCSGYTTGPISGTHSGQAFHGQGSVRHSWILPLRGSPPGRWTQATCEQGWDMGQSPPGSLGRCPNAICSSASFWEDCGRGRGLSRVRVGTEQTVASLGLHSSPCWTAGGHGGRDNSTPGPHKPG